VIIVFPEMEQQFIVVKYLSAIFIDS